VVAHVQGREVIAVEPLVGLRDGIRQCDKPRGHGSGSETKRSLYDASIVRVIRSPQRGPADSACGGTFAGHGSVGALPERVEAPDTRDTGPGLLNRRLATISTGTPG
jgi:hypothetical protein